MTKKKSSPPSTVKAPALKSKKRPPVSAGDASRWLQTLPDIAPAAIYRTDANGSCQWVNERWSELTGLPSAAALGHGWLRAVHPADRTRLKREWPSMPQRRGVFISEYRYLRPDGTVRWVLGRASAQRDAKGKLTGYIGISVDITELREATTESKNGRVAGATALTARERQVATLLAEGKTNKAAADKLGISVRTAEAHRARIMRKLHLPSLAALVRYALTHGLIRD